MDLREINVSEEVLYEGSFLKLLKQKVKLPNGNIADRDIVRHPGGVAILAFTEEKKILLVEQFRKPFDKNFLEIPAGKIDLNEEHLISALRELEEETGYTSNSIVYLGKVAVSPGFCDEYVHLYKATNLEKRNLAHPDEDEFLNIKEVTIEELKKLILDGVITDAKTVAAMFFWQNSN